MLQTGSISPKDGGKPGLPWVANVLCLAGNPLDGMDNNSFCVESLHSPDRPALPALQAVCSLLSRLHFHAAPGAALVLSTGFPP